MNGICDTFGCSNSSDYHTYCRSCRAGVCCVDQCSNFAAKQGKCARHADHSAKRVTMHQIDEAIAIVGQQGRTLLSVGHNEFGHVVVQSACANGHQSIQQLTSVRKGANCNDCRKTNRSKFHYSLSDFREGTTNPEMELHLYLYAWDEVGKTGLGRPSDYWDIRGGHKLHHSSLPAIVASAAEDMILNLLQGDDYRNTVPIQIGNRTDTTTEWWPVSAYYFHRDKVNAILQWATKPSTLEFFTSNLHTQSVEIYFGPNPPTEPDKETMT